MLALFLSRGALRSIQAAVLLALFTIVGVGGATSASWAAPTPGANDPGKLVLVLDSSGSMREPTASGQPRIDAAKDALGEVIKALPDGQEVGMRVYGATVKAQANTQAEGACLDSQLVVPLAADNRDELTASLTEYAPFGETPIAYALAQAEKDLGGQGRGQILLVSDGAESCVPDPCAVAGNLSANSPELAINVVGLNVSGEARDNLQCIARSGNGQYFDADDAASLTQSLNQAAKRKAEGFTPSGVRVEGARSAEDATALAGGAPTAPAKYVDRLAAEDAPLYYRIPRTIKNSTIWFNVTGSAPDAELRNDPTTAVVDLRSDCYTTYPGFYTSLAREFSDGLVVSGDSGGDRECATGNEVVVEVDPGDIRDTAFEITVIEEPPVASTENLPEPSRPEPTPVDAGAPKTAPWATTTALAERVEPGTYEFELVGGEMRFVAVDLDWGQRIQLTLQRTGTSKMDGFAVVVPPTGGQAAFRYDGFGVASLRGDRDSANTTTTAAAFMNRFNGEDREVYVPMSMPGRYLVGVATEFTDSGDAMEVQSGQLQIDVLGQPVAAPQYVVEPVTNSAGGAIGTLGAITGSIPTALLLVIGAFVLAVAGAMFWWLSRRRAAAPAQRFRSTYTEPGPLHAAKRD